MTLAAHRHFQDLAAYEWALVGLAALVGAWSIWMAVRYTLRPGEDEPDHVKRSILDDPVAIRVAAAAPKAGAQESGEGGPGGSGGGVAPPHEASSPFGPPAPPANSPPGLRPGGPADVLRGRSAPSGRR